MTEKNTWRLYRDLSWLWPMWGDADGEYRAWCDEVAELARRYGRREPRTLLNMGCGGGKNAFNLKREFAVTGIDISPAMLEQAGMEYLIEWLEPRLPGVAITHVPAGDPFVHL